MQLGDACDFFPTVWPKWSRAIGRSRLRLRGPSCGPASTVVSRPMTRVGGVGEPGWRRRLDLEIGVLPAGGLVRGGVRSRCWDGQALRGERASHGQAFGQAPVSSCGT
jgi:hypothetical protein